MDAPKIKTKSKFKVKHQKRKLFRANEPLYSVFMWGVNYSLVELSHANIPVMLLPDDFKSYMKVKVDLQYFNQDVLPSHYKFKAYCPLVFRAFREIFKISDRTWKVSLTTTQLLELQKGRAWYSFDRKFFIKSISSDEVENLHSILPDLHKYYVETKGDCLLPHILDFFRVHVGDKIVYMMVFENIFSPTLKIHEKFDIKGATVDRNASSKEKSNEPPSYKDNDLINLNRFICIGDNAKRIFMEKIKRDVEFLTALKIMDYSLLIGIHDCASPSRLIDDIHSSSPPDISGDESDYDFEELDLSLSGSPGSPDGFRMEDIGFHGIPSEGQSKREVYFMGLIDILTFYGARKKTFHLAKTAKYGSEAEISNVKPEQYAKRFLEFVDKIVV